MMASNVRNQTTPYWLSFCGTSHTGKTFLASITYDYIKDLPQVANHKTLIHGVRRIHWPTYATRFYNREMHLIDELIDLNFLFVDELTCGADNSGFERDCMCRVLLAREGKWTLITTNHFLKDIAQRIDARIGSRLTREGSIAIDVQTTPYGMR